MRAMAAADRPQQVVGEGTDPTSLADIPRVETARQHAANASRIAILEMKVRAWTWYDYLQVNGIDRIRHCLTQCISIRQKADAHLTSLFRKVESDREEIERCYGVADYAFNEQQRLSMWLEDMEEMKRDIKGSLADWAHELSKGGPLDIDIWADMPWVDEPWPGREADGRHR